MNFRIIFLVCALLGLFCGFTTCTSQAYPSQSAIGLTLAQFTATNASYAASGFRPVCLDANGATNNPHIAATWVNDGFNNWTAVLGVTRSEYSNQVATLTAGGYRPICVDSYGDFANERYVAVWVKDAQVSAGWAQVFGLSESAFGTAWNNYANAGYRPVWTSITGVGANKNFSGIWIKDGLGFWTYWNMSSNNLTGNMANILAQGGRPISLAGYDDPASPQFVGNWIYAEQPAWTWNFAMSAGDFQNTNAVLVAGGYRPIFVNEYGDTNNPKYAAAWIQDPLPAVWNSTGITNSTLAALDAEMSNYMTVRHIERGQLAVTRNGKLVFNHAYTLAPTNATLTQTTNLFRIASLTKQFTSVAVMQLAQNGKLGLDQQIGTILNLSNAVDSRFPAVTIRQLLQHYGGWDRSISPDPMFNDFTISSALGRPLPTTPQMIIDYMKTQNLDHAPGTVYAYSNFGYCLLGRIIEAVTGMTYEQYLQTEVLQPAGIWDMALGKPLLADANVAEVDYQDPLRRLVPSVMGSNSPSIVPVQYGGWNISSMDAHGQWIGSAADLVRFSSSFDVQTNSPLLPLQWIETMWSVPSELPANTSSYYGAGWSVRPLGGDTYNAWHDGSLDGTFSYTVRLADGICWAVVFNRRAALNSDPDYENIDGEMNAAIGSISTWPTGDLFDQNNDGILDAWQTHFFGSPNALAANPSADPDHDGVNNLNEFINLTDPTNANSYEKVVANVIPQAAGQIKLGWFGTRGRTFTMQSATSLSSPTWTDMPSVSNLIGDGMMHSVTNAIGPVAFYRLSSRLQRP